MPVAPQPAPPSGGAEDRRGPTGALYRVLPDGLWDQLWESRDDAPYDVAVESADTVLLATGRDDPRHERAPRLAALLYGGRLLTVPGDTGSALVAPERPDVGGAQAGRLSCA